MRDSRKNSDQLDALKRHLLVDYVSIDSLKPHPNRSRLHSKAQIRKLRRSLDTFGFMKPIVIGPDGVIIAGHGIVEAAKAEGYTEVPTVFIADLTPDLLRAYLLTDNRTAEDGTWDDDLLRIEFQHFLEIPDFDLGVTAFEMPEIDLVLQETKSETDPIDSVPLVTAEAVSEAGDLWLLGEHRILCGDARDASAYALLCNDRKAAAAFCDPPFNVAIDGHATGNGRVHHADFAMASGEMSSEEFTRFLAGCLGNLTSCSLPGSVHFVCMDWRHMAELLAAGHEVYDALLNVCVWTKDNGGMGAYYRSQHELVFVFKAGKGSPLNNIQLGRFGRNRTNVWRYPGANTLSRKPGEENLLAMHPTVKPVALVADALLDCTKRRDIVLDSFLGSGSTLLAAERVGRICYGMELEGRYVDLAIRRWQQLTGEEARHAVTGEAFNSMEVDDGR